MSRARDEAPIKAFAVVLREARPRCEMTQEDVARRAGIDRTSLGLLESSKRQPTLSVICALEPAVSETPGSLVAKAFALSEATGSQDLCHVHYDDNSDELASEAARRSPG